MQLRKKDAETGKQLKSANAPFQLGCFLYFFPEEKYMIKKHLYSAGYCSHAHFLLHW